MLQFDQSSCFGRWSGIRHLSPFDRGPVDSFFWDVRMLQFDQCDAPRPKNGPAPSSISKTSKRKEVAPDAEDEEIEADEDGTDGDSSRRWNAGNSLPRLLFYVFCKLCIILEYSCLRCIILNYSCILLITTYLFLFIVLNSETNISVSVQRAYCLLNAAEYRRNILIWPLSGRRTTAVHRIWTLCSGEWRLSHRLLGFWEWLNAAYWQNLTTRHAFQYFNLSRNFISPQRRKMLSCNFPNRIRYIGWGALTKLQPRSGGI